MGARPSTNLRTFANAANYAQPQHEIVSRIGRHLAGRTGSSKSAGAPFQGRALRSQLPAPRLNSSIIPMAPLRSDSPRGGVSIYRVCL